MPDQAEQDAAMVALLSDSDARCPQCGYRLRGMTAARCPECGHRVTLDGLTRSRSTPLTWMLAIVALAACLPESWGKWQRLIFKADGRVYYGDQRFPWITTSWPARLDGLRWLDWCRFILSYAFWLGIPLAVIALMLGHRRWAVIPRRWQWVATAVIVVAVLLAYRRWMFWYWWWVADARGGWPPTDLWWLRP